MLRYSEKVPEYLFQIDPNKREFKTCLRMWIRENIDKEGDYIFKGKMRPRRDDWLCLEIDWWKQKLEHSFLSHREWAEIEEEYQNEFI